MNSICPCCRRDLSAADTHTNRFIATCTACGSRFLCTDGIIKDRMPALPSGYRIDQDGFDLVIVRTWFRWVSFFLPIFSIVWSVAFYLSMEGNYFTLILPLGFGCIVLYLGIVALCNRTIIRISRTSLSIRHRPLPWPGNTQIPVEHIEQIHCRRREIVTRDKRKTDYVYHVIAILCHGRCVDLITDLLEANEAAFIEKTIELYLGIDNVRMVDGAQYLVDVDSERRQKFWGRTIAISVLILLAAFLVPTIWNDISNPDDDRVFDATIWQVQRYNTWHNPRRQMIDDLCKHHLHQGMTMDEVIALLGKPDAKPIDTPGYTTIEYRLGQWELLFPAEQMTIWFDLDGRVTECRAAGSKHNRLIVNWY